MLNAAVEDWFADQLGRSFHGLHVGDRIGTPTVALEVQFVAPGLLGEILDISLVPARVGATSCTVAFEITCAGSVRLHGKAVLVCMNLDTKKSQGWPATIKRAMEAGQAVLESEASDSDDRVA